MNVLPNIVAGELTDRVILQSPEIVKNEFNEDLDDWWDRMIVWGKYEPLGGSELMQGQQVRADITGMLTIRYYPGIDTGWRAKIGTKVMNFALVRNVGNANVLLEILTSEVTT